jgi:hypothetical protein
VSLAFFTYLATEYLLEPLAWLPVYFPADRVNEVESVFVGCYFNGLFGIIDRSARGFHVLLVNAGMD